jgi:hypothetical protein
MSHRLCVYNLYILISSSHVRMIQAEDGTLLYLDSAFQFNDPCSVIQGDSRSILEGLPLRE